jgi:hypothetical protein
LNGTALVGESGTDESYGPNDESSAEMQDLAHHVFFAAERSEAPVLGDDDLLETRELVLGSAESLESSGTVCSVVSN